MPPAYIASPSAVDQPAVGLVLAFAALFSLPQSANMFVQIWRYEGFTGRIGILTLLMIGEQLLQLATGVAIAWQWRGRRALGLVYFAAALALIILSFVFIKDVAGVRYRAVTVLEAIGSPLLVLIAPRWFGVTRLTRASALGGLLVVSGVSIWLGQSIFGIQKVRWFLGEHVSTGAWLGELVRVASALVPATVGLVAGLRMASGRPARRMFAAYVITAIGMQIVMTVLSVIVMLTNEGRYVSIVLPTTLVMTVFGIVRPMLIWLYAKRESEPGADVGAALPWVALWFVPQLVARALMYDEITMVLGKLAIPIVVLCGLCAIMNIGAARVAMRGESAVRWWIAAATAALGLLAVAFVAVYTIDQSRPSVALTAGPALMPVGLLFATAATAAWLSRRLRSSR